MEGYLRKRGVRLALLFLIILGTFALVYYLQAIFAPLILGFLIAYVLDPFADRLEDWKFSRLWAVITIFALATVVFAVVIITASFYATKGVKIAFERAVGEKYLGTDDLARYPKELHAQNPDFDPKDPRSHRWFLDRNQNKVREAGYLEKAQDFLVRQAEERDFDPEKTKEAIQLFTNRIVSDFTNDKGRFDLGQTLDSRLIYLIEKHDSLSDALLEYIRPPREPGEPLPEEDVRELSERVARDSAEQTIARFLKEEERQVAEEPAGAGGGFALLSWLVLCPLYVFFFLLEIDPMIASIKRHLPAMQRDRIVRIFREIDKILSSFFRGRLVVCLVKGGLTSIGLLLLGVPFWFPIGMAAGFLSLVPYVGIWIAILPALLLSWLEHESMVRLGGIGVVFAVMEAVEGFVLIPTFLGKEIGLHPLTIVVTLLVFAKIFGFVGVLLSVPLAAITKILANEFVMPIIREFADEDPRAPPAESST